jgi:AAA family ATPase
LKKRKDSGLDLPITSRETTQKAERKRTVEVPEAQMVLIRDIGYPFRIKGDPKPSGLEIDNDGLFADYAREQWAGSVVRKGMYLFDRYVMPDFAFQVVEIEPPESVITQNTQVYLQPSSVESESLGPVITMDDVIGHESVKRKCRVILKYLISPSKFGEWAPRAVLFYGPPGTGKTLMARALAHEANAQIIATKASDLIGTHVGDGGRRISSLFEEARNLAPSIVFIDELDAIGLARSFQSIRGDVSEVVTALLAELDRTDERSGVVVIGATNALMLIDTAIRSRFDSSFEFGIPNAEERLRILEMYAKRLPIPIDFGLQEIVGMTDGYSGRDLRDRVLKEALHQAISEDKSMISLKDVVGIIEGIGTKKAPEYTV